MITFKTFLTEKVSFDDVKLPSSKVAKFNPKHSGYDWVIGDDWINFSRSPFKANDKKFNIVNSSNISQDDYVKMLNHFLMKTKQLGTDGIISFKTNPSESTHHDYQRSASITKIWKSIDGAIKDGTTFMLERK